MPGHLRTLRLIASALLVSAVGAACLGPTPPGPPATIFVSGSVLLFGGGALPGSDVYLDDGSGLRDPVVTDAMGGFEVADVSVPYAVTIVPPGASGLTPMTWAGITRPNPKLVLQVETSGGMPAACASGTGRVAGFLNPPVGASNTAEVFFVSKALTIRGVSFGADERGPGATAYEILPLFDGTTCPAGALGMVLYVERNAAGNIARMAVVNDVFVANDETVSTMLDLDTGPAQMAVLSGAVELPPGVDEAEVAPVIKIGDAYALMDATTVSSASPDFALTVPLVAGAQYRIRASKTSLGTSLSWAWSNLVTAPASDITLALPPIGDMVSPSGPIANTSPTFTYTEVEATNLYSALVIKGSIFAHIAMGDETMVSIPELPPPAQLTGDLTWAVVGITARDADSAEDLLDGRMTQGLFLSTFAMDDPDFVRSGFVNANFLNFSLP